LEYHEYEPQAAHKADVGPSEYITYDLTLPAIRGTGGAVGKCEEVGFAGGNCGIMTGRRHNNKG